MIDRKRLRELALGALDEPRDVYDPRRSQFLNAANPQTILALLDALEAPTDDARDAARYRWLREQSHPWGGKWYSLARLDTAIDAAIAERTKE